MADSKLVVFLKLDGTEFGKGISQAQADTAKLGAAFSAVGVAAGAAVKFAANFQDSMIKTARSAGMASASFSSLAYAANLSGVQAGELAKNMTKLQNPSETATRAFKDLGIQIKDSKGNLKDQGQLLNELSDRLAGITDPATRSQAAIRIFGEEGAKMASLLEGGSKALAEARKEAYEFGQTVSKEAGENAEKFNDNIAKVTMGLSGLRNVVAESAIEFINQSKALETVQNALKGAIEWWRGLSDSTKETIMLVVSGVAAFGGLLLALSAVAAILPAIAAGFKLLIGPVGLIILGVTGLAAALTLLRTDQDKQIKAAEEAERQAVRNGAAWKDNARALEELRGKSKLTGAEQDKLADIKKRVAAEALRLGQNINVETMSLQQLIDKTKEFQRIQKVEQYKEINKQLVDLGKRYNETTANLERVNKEVENLTKSGFGGAAMLKAYTDSSARLTKQQAELQARLTAVGKKLEDSNKKEEEAIQTAIKFSSATEQVDRSWVYATRGLDGFNSAVGNFVRDTAPDMISAQLEFEEFSRAVERSMEKSKVAIATAGLVEAAAKVAQQVIAPFGQLTDAIAKGIEYDSQVALRDLDVVSNRAAEAYKANREALEMQEAEKIKALEKSFDEQIRVLTEGENAKNQAAQRAADERLLIANDEYERAKAAAEEKFKADLERDQMEYEAKMALLEERALDREQRQLTETIMEEDARLLREQREREHEARLAELAKEFAGKQKSIDADLKATEKANADKNKAEIEALQTAKAEALTAAEAEKNAKLKALDEQRAKEEKDLEKQRLQTQYNAQVDAFNATKATKMAETVASGIASAAQAFAALAPIPFVGVALGTAAAAVITAAMGMRVAQIEKQKPIKPAGLLEDGGVIAGNITHAQGGIPAEVESGEMFIDKGRTAKMLRAIDNGLAGMGGGVTVNIMAGAIQGDIRDESTLNKLADKLGRQIQRRMVFA